MVRAQTLQFLRDLGENNSKDWVDANRDRWDATRANFIAIVNQFIQHADRYDPRIKLAGIDPKRSFTRLNRDPRLRHGRPPYKTFSAVFANPGDTLEAFGYYIHIEPGECYAGASLFIPTVAALMRMRTKIANHPDEWARLLADDGFRKAFPNGVEALYSLKSVPRGFDPGHPAARYLKMKGYGLKAPATDLQVQKTDAINHLVDLFKTARPVADFLNE
jgi:uncharacterized protein (TIGR02453 family)